MINPEIGADEAEIIRIMTKMPEFRHLETLDLEEIRHEITYEITKILREYWENTRGHETDWSKKFAEVEITKDDGRRQFHAQEDSESISHDLGLIAKFRNLLAGFG